MHTNVGNNEGLKSDILLIDKLGELGQWRGKIITIDRRCLDYSAHGQLGPVRDNAAPILRQLGPGVETARPNDK